jgi:hypothetical protein
LEIVTNPVEMIEGFVHVVIHPVDTFKYISKAIEDSFERDMVKGDAYSRSRWVTYALSTAINTWYKRHWSCSQDRAIDDKNGCKKERGKGSDCHRSTNDHENFTICTTAPTVKRGLLHLYQSLNLYNSFNFSKLER